MAVQEPLAFLALVEIPTGGFVAAIKVVGFAKQMEAFSRQDNLELLAFGKLARDDVKTQ